MTRSSSFARSSWPSASWSKARASPTKRRRSKRWQLSGDEDHWTPLALAKVREISEYIALDRAKAAERWVVNVFDFVKRLSRFPKRGRVVPEVGRDDVRELLHGKYRIIYRLEDDGAISILTVRHGSRLLDLKEVEA
ncbi:MAG TPA: type II toxin-antitoxin system RelE/ParE family toxin [Thermoanaerobaculia bacterium]